VGISFPQRRGIRDRDLGSEVLCYFCMLIGTSEPGRWKSYLNLNSHVLAHLGGLCFLKLTAGLAEKCKTGQRGTAPKALDVGAVGRFHFHLV
jgi:hypothetical protein